MALELKTLTRDVARGMRLFVKIFKDKEVVSVSRPVSGHEILHGKVALITGGSGGIGLAIAKALLRSGCKVIITGTNENKLIQSREEIERDCMNANGRIRSLILNVLHVNEMPEKVQEAAGLFSENKVDILVNCAGKMDSFQFGEITEETYDRVMDINLKGSFFMSQAVCNYMIRNKIRGHILNVSSSAALRNAWNPYQISKWGIRGFTKGLADKAIPYGIVVNAIAPGPTATAMISRKPGDTLYLEENPSKRYATPEEIANLALFLVSDMADLVVGDTFYITGGSGVITLHD